MSQKKPSVYASLSCEVGSTIPRRALTRDSWVRSSYQSSHPISFSEGCLSDKNPPRSEPLPDEGYVRRKTMFFDSQPLRPPPPAEEKPRPQEPVSRVIKYRVRRPYLGYPKSPSVFRRTLGDFEFMDSTDQSGEVKSPSKKRVLRRHTTHLPPAGEAPQGNPEGGGKKLAPAWRRETQDEDLQEATAAKSSKIPDPSTAVPVSYRSDAVVRGRGSDAIGTADNLSRHQISAYDDSKGRRCVYDVGAMNGLRQETPSVPRVVAASVKSYQDIPEELFNSLPESSVDPDGEPKEESNNSEWTNMLEVRRALLLQEGSDTEAESEDKRESPNLPTKQTSSSKTSKLFSFVYVFILFKIKNILFFSFWG